MIPTTHKERLLAVDVFMYTDEIEALSKDEIIECVKKIVDTKERPFDKSIVSHVLEEVQK